LFFFLHLLLLLLLLLSFILFLILLLLLLLLLLLFTFRAVPQVAATYLILRNFWLGSILDFGWIYQSCHVVTTFSSPLLFLLWEGNVHGIINEFHKISPKSHQVYVASQ
jgi:hypothetical protein